MKKELRIFALGIFAGALISGTVSFAVTGTSVIEAVYNNIVINIDGKNITPKDANGNKTEPFIYNGTTYLPVRAVGEALGKTVEWDSETNTVYLFSGKNDVPQPTDTDFESLFEQQAHNVDDVYPVSGDESSFPAEKVMESLDKTADMWRWQCVYAADKLKNYEPDIQDIDIYDEINKIYFSRISAMTAEEIDPSTQIGKVNSATLYCLSAKEYAKTLLYRLYQYTSTVVIDGSVG